MPTAMFSGRPIGLRLVWRLTSVWTARSARTGAMSFRDTAIVLVSLILFIAKIVTSRANTLRNVLNKRLLDKRRIAGPEATGRHLVGNLRR